MAEKPIQPGAAGREPADRPSEFKSLELHLDAPVIERPPRAGDRCPRCGEGRVDYDGLLNLTCEACGFTLAGCFT